MQYHQRIGLALFLIAFGESLRCAVMYEPNGFIVPILGVVGIITFVIQTPHDRRH